MVVLHSFSPELGTSVLFQLKGSGVKVSGLVGLLFAAIIVEERVTTKRSLSVGTSGISI